MDESTSEHGWRRSQYLRRQLPPVRGSRTFNAILPNGRIVWLGVDPSLAPASETNHLVQQANRAADRREDAIRARSLEIQRLTRDVRRRLDKIAASGLRGDRRLRRQLVTTSTKLDRRISERLAEQRLAGDRLMSRMAVYERRAAGRTLWDQLVVASALPLFAAYGQKSDPFGSHNVVLAVSLAVWLVGDDLTDFLTGEGRRRGDAPRGADLWSYLAPVANMLTGWLLLGDRQHEPLVSGVADDLQLGIAPPSSAAERFYLYEQAVVVDVAPGHSPDFMTFLDVPAIATIASLTFASGLDPLAEPRVVGVRAHVDGGVLFVSVLLAASLQADVLPDDLRASPDALTVAFVVDTRPQGEP